MLFFSLEIQEFPSEQADSGYVSADSRLVPGTSCGVSPRTGTGGVPLRKGTLGGGVETLQRTGQSECGEGAPAATQSLSPETWRVPASGLFRKCSWWSETHRTEVCDNAQWGISTMSWLMVMNQLHWLQADVCSVCRSSSRTNEI